MSQLNKILTLSSACLLFAGSACTKDKVPGTDGAPGAPQQNCGHGCIPEAEDPINLDEGGEVRLEIIHNKDGLGFEVRTHGWFASAQDPQSRPFQRDPTTWQVTVLPGDEFPNGICTDMRAKDKFPNGIPTSRAYIDAGDKVTLTAGDTTFELDRYNNLQDQVFNNVFDIGYYADLNYADVDTNTEYTVTLGDGTELADTLLMPPAYDVTFPDLRETVYIPAGTDFPMIWDVDSLGDVTKADGFLYGFAAFGDALGIQYLCTGPNKGEMSIPAAVIDDLPPSGWMQHGILSHHAVVSNADENRRIDLQGISCNQGRYTRVSNP